MKLLTHPVVTALGLTQLYLLSGIARLESPDRLYLYHWSGSPASLFVPNLLLFCLVWSVLALLLLLARVMGRYGAVIWTVLLAPVPLVVFRCCALLTDRNLDLVTVAVYGVILAAFALMALSGHAILASRFQSVRRAADTMLGFVSIVALLSLGHISWSAWRARNLDAAPVLHHRDPDPPAKPRIIWILFDELSYRQVYEHRFPGLELPAFDQLAQQSTVFTSVIPAGDKTDHVIPALFTGQPVSFIRSSSDGQGLLLRGPGSRTWDSFDPQQTVFADALSKGYSTAVAGWYNPYCRIMPEVLDQCFWTENMPSVGAMSPHYGVYGNIRVSLAHKATFLDDLINRLRHKPTFDPEEMKLHQLDYTQLSAASDRLLQDPSATFAFLHLPAPHPHGIYDRSTGKFATTQTTYIDNLVLADHYLAEARSLLEHSGEWDSSTVIVMGDHSWRTYMWDEQQSWTAEEQRASQGGRFDPRPAYIVKLPHQHEAARIGIPYAALHTRAMFDALMDGQIASSAALAAWAAQAQNPASSNALVSGGDTASGR